MQYAVMSDIHGNAAALTAVLQSVTHEGIRHLLIAGDFLGYYYRAKEAFALLADFAWRGIKGNHDAIFEDFARWTDADRDAYRKKYGHALYIAREELSAKDLETLRSLPGELRLTIDGKQVLLAHGAPWASDERVYPDAPPEVFRRIASLGYDFVILGHTHYPFLKRVGACVILNPGSVGQPRDEGSVASWAEVDFAGGEVLFHRVSVDLTEAIRDAKRYDPDVPYLQEVLLRKRTYMRNRETHA